MTLVCIKLTNKQTNAHQPGQGDRDEEDQPEKQAFIEAECGHSVQCCCCLKCKWEHLTKPGAMPPLLTLQSGFVYATNTEAFS